MVPAVNSPIAWVGACTEKGVFHGTMSPDSRHRRDPGRKSTRYSCFHKPSTTEEKGKGEPLLVESVPEELRKVRRIHKYTVHKHEYRHEDSEIKRSRDKRGLLTIRRLGQRATVSMRSGA